MPKAFFPVLAFVFVLLAATGGSGAALGASSGGASKPAEFLKTEQEIKSGNFEAAIPLLEGLVAKNAKDPDSLNYLGYSHRKLGQFEVAEDYSGGPITLSCAFVGLDRDQASSWLSWHPGDPRAFSSSPPS